MSLFIIPFFAIYSLASLIYILDQEKYSINKAILLVCSALIFVTLTFNWYDSADYSINTFLLAMFLIHVWTSLTSIVYLILRRKHGFAKAIIPLIINLISISAIWTSYSLINPKELYYRYYWRQDGLNVIVQEIETGKLKPQNSTHDINLPNAYRYLAYEGWVRAELNSDGWSILFYDSPFSGYLYREDGPAIPEFVDCGNFRRINANWFYCNPY